MKKSWMYIIFAYFPAANTPNKTSSKLFSMELGRDIIDWLLGFCISWLQHKLDLSWTVSFHISDIVLGPFALGLPALVIRNEFNWSTKISNMFYEHYQF